MRHCLSITTNLPPTSLRARPRPSLEGLDVPLLFGPAVSAIPALRVTIKKADLHERIDKNPGLSPPAQDGLDLSRAVADETPLR